MGSTFQFVGKPMFGWNGIVNCKVLEALEPSVFRYSWLVEGGRFDGIDASDVKAVMQSGRARERYDKQLL